MVTRRILFVVGAALAVHSAVFGGYRVIFLERFGQSAEIPEFWRMLRYGWRLDLALFGIELSVIGLATILGRRLRRRGLWWWFWSLTGLHLLLCTANIFTFAERSQNAGELVLPYITSPYQVYLAVMPFCREHGLVMVVLGAVAVGYVWLGCRLSRRMETQAIDLWRSPGTLAAAVGLAVAPLVLTIQPLVQRKSTTSQGGKQWKLRITDSLYFTLFSQRVLNEAVVNPLFELIRVQIPSQMTSTVRYHLSEAEALEVWRRQAGRPAGDARYPLLTAIHGPADSDIENVIVIQVESLSQWMLAKERDGRPVMPFLRRLAADGLYFPNTFQNANFTSGGLFSTATGLPKAPYEEITHRFTAYEMTGSYSSLPRVLGSSSYQHFFLEGFEQSCDPALAFMAHQGYQAFGYRDFRDILRRKQQWAAGESLLGVYDGCFLQESAEILLRCPTRFTAHLFTATTHSPWAVPPSFPRAWPEPDLNAFAYLDASIQAFCERLQKVPAVWEKTLVVVLGDHTSIDLGGNFLEALRIPLILYSPHLPVPEKQNLRWASEVDVVPTVLALLRGDHWHAGVGRNLLDPSAPDTGIVTGTTMTGYYLKDGYVLEYDPAKDSARLWALTNDNLGPDDLAAQQTDLCQRLRREYFAEIELVKRLTVSQRVFPWSADALNRLSATAPPALENAPTARPVPPAR